MTHSLRFVCVLFVFVASAAILAADKFEPMDVFDLEWAADPQISPNGRWVVYERHFMDKKSDRRRSNLWIVATSGGEHRPLTTGSANDRSPRWSPDGKRLLYISARDGGSQLWMRWMDGGETARLTTLDFAPSAPAWSPDGKAIAFSMFVPDPPAPLVPPLSAPEGADWAPRPKVIESVYYRSDGAGYLQPGQHQLFVLPASGGTPRQLTDGRYRHRERPTWTADGKALIFSANRNADWERDPNDTNLHRVDLADGKLTRLTDRYGPDRSPVVSPDGRRVAYLGFDDRHQGYQVTRLHVLDLKTQESKVLTESFDRSVRSPRWEADSQAILVGYSDRGEGRVARVALDGKRTDRVHAVGGVALGRPYASGSFSVAQDGTIAYTHSDPQRPADVAVVAAGGNADSRTPLTALNEDLFGHRHLGLVEEIVFDSSHDEREIQGWIVYPPGFDAAEKYPLLLEIHGGPFADYGPRFAAEMQLYAAAGYVVLYINPRGSTSYGEEFGNLIHHDYPGADYDDLMSGVDALAGRGFIDPERLFVTGGSGGGVLTAWIVGKTDRFAAAVSAKPVINWYSFALTADMYGFFHKYWFGAYPWDNPEEYLRRSPLSLVGNVKTPTMLLTGEADYRTPMSESEQYYQALKLREIDTALVRIPEASHGIAARPSHLIDKVRHILAWFARYGGPGAEADEPASR